MGQPLICQHICKKIMYVQHQIYPSSASFNAHSYRRVIHLLWHLKYSEQSSIHFRFKRECGKVRGQMEIEECKINIATCHWTNQKMYNTRFMNQPWNKKNLQFWLEIYHLNNMKNLGWGKMSTNEIESATRDRIRLEWG